MRQFGAIFTREFRAYFNSPIAYAVLAVFLVLTGWQFDTLVSNFLRLAMELARRQQMMQQQMPALNLNELVIRNYFGFVVFIVPIVLTPMLTMRLFSEEKRQGTMELLLTTPVTDWQIVLGKYAAALALYALMLVASFLHLFFLYLWGNPDTGPVLAGYLGLLLVGGAYLSVGLFISSLTENQIVAVVLTFAVNLLFFLIGSSADLVGEGLGNVLRYLSVIGHYQGFDKGVVSTTDIVYFVTFTVVGLLLTLRSVESLRWKG